MNGLTVFGRSRPGFARLVCSVLITATTLSACSPWDGLPPAVAYSPSVYRLGKGDQVRVLTYGDDQLSNDFRVGEDGNIAMPLLGNVKAEGLTPEQLSAQVANDLKQRGLLRNPSVAIEITAHRPVFILGEVNKPGQYPYEQDMTMLSLAAVAGGFTYRAVEGKAYVVRQTDTGSNVGTLQPQDYIKPGDVVKIYERIF